MTTQEQEDQLSTLAQELFNSGERAFTPMYPWVLVRTLQRDGFYKGLIALPEHEQNKVTHEGIVVATWKPRLVEKGTKQSSPDGKVLTKATIQKSQLVIGQHVLYPHWAGQPAFGFSPALYRLVKECDWEAHKDGGIVGVIEYDDAEDSVMGQLTNILGIDEEGIALAHRILDKFCMIDKDRKAIMVG
jgi:co-chaperonin GroES (HSP10)